MTLKFCPNLSTLFLDSPFLERFSRAKEVGFSQVEFQFPYDFPPEQIRKALLVNHQEVILFNIYSGNPSAGERGLAALPGRIKDFHVAVDQAIQYAKIFNGHKINCLVGLRDLNYPLEDQLQVLEENLTYAAMQFEENKIQLVIEHLNPFDVPGFLISTPKQAFDLISRFSIPNLKVQFDIYHAQRSQGELARTLQDNLTKIGHIQIADNPGRHKPGTGEINFPFLFKLLSSLGYSGYIGLEYFSDAQKEDLFDWMRWIPVED